MLIAVRLPRVLAAFGVGSLLALSGVLLQALFRNPLADPYVLGVSGGAAVGALLAMIAGLAAVVVQSAAVAGALGAVGVVYLLARGGGTPRLLLTGVVLASACGALVSVLLALADSSRVRGMVFWLAGDLEWAVNPWLSAGAALLAVALAVLVARPLNVLASGELRARTVGLALEGWRTLLFIACATLTALAVVSAGTVGFVGLIVPHAVRLSFRTSDHRIVAPAAALAGGMLLAAADLRGAHHRQSAAAAGRGDHGAGGGAAVRGAAARAQPLGERGDEAVMQGEDHRIHRQGHHGAQHADLAQGRPELIASRGNGGERAGSRCCGRTPPRPRRSGGDAWHRSRGCRRARAAAASRTAPARRDRRSRSGA